MKISHKLMKLFDGSGLFITTATHAF